MNSLYVYHHLGMGDNFMLNGLIRHIATQYEKIFLFAKPKFAKNILDLYRDEHKIKIIALDDGDVRQFINFNKQNKYLIIGHTPDFFKRVEKGEKTFDQLFYEDCNVHFEYKWTNFYYKRDLDKEKDTFYNILKLTDDDKFIFVHDSKERPITREIPANTKIIRPDNNQIGIYDFLYTIEKAQQVHVMNSSFMNLIDCMQLRNDNLFYHEYSRPNINTILKLNWKILK